MSKYTKRGRYALKKSRKIPEEIQEALDEYAAFSQDVQAIWAQKIEDKKACHKGCSHCCHLLSMIHFGDAVLIAQYLLSHQMQPQMEALRHMANLQKNFMRKYDRFRDEEGFVDAWLDEWIACPLLSDEGACTIYPVRPVACWHHAASNVEGCKRENVKTASTALRQPTIIEAMAKADFELWWRFLDGHIPLPLPTSLGIVVALGFVLNGGDTSGLMEHLQPIDPEDLLNEEQAQEGQAAQE
jgi:Fe-S-cluster containining protein